MTDTINIPRAELQAALNALEDIGDEWGFTSDRTLPARRKAVELIRVRLAQQEEKPEPVAFGIIACNTGKICEVALSAEEVAEIHPRYIAPLYAEPQKRPWQGLTDEEIGKVCGFCDFTAHSTQITLTAIARAIEAALREKNT